MCKRQESPENTNTDNNFQLTLFTFHKLLLAVFYTHSEYFQNIYMYSYTVKHMLAVNFTFFIT